MRIERRSHIGYKIQDGVKSPYSKGISSILFEFEINDPLLKSIEFDELMIAIRKVRRKAIDEYKNKYEELEINFKKITGVNICDVMSQLKKDGWVLTSSKHYVFTYKRLKS